MSAVGVALQPSISRVPDEVVREEGKPSIDSFRAKGLERVPHKLNVLLRHRPPSISLGLGSAKWRAADGPGTPRASSGSSGAGPRQSLLPPALPHPVTVTRPALRTPKAALESGFR